MNILAIGSHPDDIEYGCGGTLIKYSRRGHKVALLVITCGEAGGNPKGRRQEQVKSSKFLKARLTWGRFRDTDVRIEKNLIHCIELEIQKVKPDLIFVHYFADTHQDHRNVSQATLTATRYIRNVLLYEVPTTLEFNPTVFMNIGDVLKEKLRLLKAHESQVHETRVADLSILESAGSCANFRGFQNRVRYAEGFVPVRLSLELSKEPE
jgi:LmbE family N-acetylglucosaminyl deacetylase